MMSLHSNRKVIKTDSLLDLVKDYIFSVLWFLCTSRLPVTYLGAEVVANLYIQGQD